MKQKYQRGQNRYVISEGKKKTMTWHFIQLPSFPAVYQVGYLQSTGIDVNAMTQ